MYYLLTLDVTFHHPTGIGGTQLSILKEIASMADTSVEKETGCVLDIQHVSLLHKIDQSLHTYSLCSIAPLAFPPYPYPPPIPFYEGAPFPTTGMYLNPYGGGPLYYPHPILPVDDNKLQGYVKKQMWVFL